MNITLPHPVIGMEFFVRVVEFIGKDVAKSLPANTLYYTGPSLAETSFARFFGFKDGVPVTKKGFEMRNDPKYLILVAKERFQVTKRRWLREKDTLITDVVAHKQSFGFTFKQNLLPYGFAIRKMDKDGTITTDFPRATAPLAVNKTYVYLCHKRQFQPLGVSKPLPNVYLLMYIRNHGWHKTIRVLSGKELEEVDAANLCLAKDVLVRDFRKKKNPFRL